MQISGVGVATGIHGSPGVDSAIIVDNVSLYEAMMKGMTGIHGGEYRGLPGFRFIVGKQFDYDIVLGLVPPYPEAIVEAVSELYVLGVRSIIVVARGYRLIKKGIEPGTAVLVRASVPLDGVSTRIAPEGVPLLASGHLAAVFRSVAEVQAYPLALTVGTSVTLPSPRLPWSYHAVERYIGVKGVIAVDSVSSALYALQYHYPRLEALTVLAVYRSMSGAYRPVEYSADQLQRIEEEELDLQNRIYLLAVESLKKVRRGVE